VYWRIRLMLAKSFSMGLNSGEYGSKNNKLAPARINASVSEPLWKEALSITTMWLSLSKGQHTSEGFHVLKATASQAPSKSKGVREHPSTRAALKVVCR